MSEDRVERTFYPDGTLKEEVHYRGKREHGPWRKWHPNGQLALEGFYENGEMGTSNCRQWHSDGRLAGEVPFVNGHHIGRFTLWGPDGSLMQKRFSLEDGEVTWQEYQEACKVRPELHRYPDETGEMLGKKRPKSVKKRSGGNPTKPATPSSPTDREEDDRNRAFCRKMLQSKAAEARPWLASSTPDALRNLGEMGLSLSKKFVEKLYSLGAEEVLAVEIEDIPGTDDQTSNNVLAKLPADPDARARVFEFGDEHAEEQGFEGEPDRGQEYLYFKMC